MRKDSPENSPLEMIVNGEERKLPPQLKKDFAYLLGIFQLNHGHANRWKNSFNRIVNNKKVLLNLKGIAERLGTRTPRIRGRRLTIYDRRLMEALLSGVGEKFDSLIANDNERIAFLRGYFDNSRMKVRLDSRRTMEYRTSCLNPEERRRLLETFFELEIYSSLRTNYISICHFANLHRIYSLTLDGNEENRRVIKRFLEKHKSQDPYVIQKYYAVRKVSKKFFEGGRKFSLVQLGRKKGVSKTVVYSWTADIARKHERTFKLQKKPSIVVCYERLLEYFKFNNIYEAKEPARRKEKIFVPADDGYVYCLPHQAQADYLAVLEKGPAELDNEDLRYLWKELKLNLSGSEERELDISFDETRAIKSIKKLAGKGMFREVCLVVKREEGAEGQEGQRYFLPSKLQEKYFKIYEAEPEPFNEEHIKHLEGELAAFLDRKRWDLNFKFSGRTITNIHLR